MKTILPILFFLITGCTGCRQSTPPTNDFLTIDVTASYPKKELILQDFLDVEYIPLETSDEFITFGFVKAIGKDIIVLKNNKIYDGDIFIFDRKGKGIRKFNRKGQNGEEYTFTTDIYLDEKEGEIYVSCLVNRKMYVYDLKEKFKRSFKFKQEKGIAGDEIAYRPMYKFDKDHFICCDYSTGRLHDEKLEISLEPRNIFFLIGRQGGIVTEEIPVPFEKKISLTVITRQGEGFVPNNQIIPYQDRWLLADPSADTIYSYSTTRELIPFIVRTPSIQSMNPEIFLFPGVITDQYCFLQAIKKEYDENNPSGNLKRFDWVYDKKEKQTFEYTVYNSDFIDPRPIKNLTFETRALTVINNNGIAFAERIEASELSEAYRAGKLKGKLKEIAAHLDEESNPVIMLAKYKK